MSIMNFPVHRNAADQANVQTTMNIPVNVRHIVDDLHVLKLFADRLRYPVQHSGVVVGLAPLKFMNQKLHQSLLCKERAGIPARYPFVAGGLAALI